MISRNILRFIAALGILATIWGTRAEAQQLGRAPDFQVLSTTIVENVQGVNGRTITWKDNSNAKGIVLLVSANLPTDMELWATDFTLSYRRNGADDRSRCAGITTAMASPGDEGAWLIGEYANIKGKKGVRYFKLLFGLENDVYDLSLQFAQAVARTITVTRN